jgi:hypothetical protein
VHGGTTAASYAGCLVKIILPSALTELRKLEQSELRENNTEQCETRSAEITHFKYHTVWSTYIQLGMFEGFERFLRKTICFIFIYPKCLQS